MAENSNTTSGGIGFFGLLTVLFIGLKLTHFINWSWWLVLAPSLFCVALWVIVIVVAVIVAALK